MGVRVGIKTEHAVEKGGREMTRDPSSRPEPDGGGGVLGPGARWWRNLVLVGIFGLQLGLVIRTHVQDDDRYGFAMFHQYTRYMLFYDWVKEGGQEERFNPNEYLAGYGGQLVGGRLNSTVMGPGTIRLLVQDYLAWLWRRHRPDDAVAVRCIYNYEINGSPQRSSETFRHSSEGSE
jgi:hypothetical protein